MPLYEFVCQDCQRRFEALVRRFGDSASCPACAGRHVERRRLIASSLPFLVMKAQAHTASSTKTESVLLFEPSEFARAVKADAVLADRCDELFRSNEALHVG